MKNLVLSTNNGRLINRYDYQVEYNDFKIDKPLCIVAPLGDFLYNFSKIINEN